MAEFFEKLLGASWRTSLLGILGGIVLEIQNMAQEGGVIPSDMTGWLKVLGAILLGALGISAKSANVSNAPNPAKAAVVEKKANNP